MDHRRARAGEEAGGEVAKPGERTLIYVPRRHYPDGYRATARGAEVVSAANSQRLVLKRRPGAARISLLVRRRG